MSNLYTPVVFLNCEQGTEEWYKARAGRITGSGIGDVLTGPATKAAKEEGAMGKTAAAYLNSRALELASGQVRETRLSALDAIKHGNKYEEQAAEAFTRIMGFQTEKIGTIQCGKYLATSPDRIVIIGDLRVPLEIKCPFSPAEHDKNLSLCFGDELQKEQPGHWRQVQWHNWNMEAPYGFFMSYDQDLEACGLSAAIIRVEADSEFAKLVEDKLPKAIAYMEERAAHYRRVAEKNLNLQAF